MSFNKVLILGTGNMGNAYAEILSHRNLPFQAHGNSCGSSLKFSERWACHTTCEELGQAPDYSGVSHVILALPQDILCESALDVGSKTSAKILLEKPGCLYLNEAERMESWALDNPGRLYVGFNRRCYKNVALAKKIIADRGEQVRFIDITFNERTHIVEKSKRSSEIKGSWVLSNSSHVIDLGFHFSGFPVNYESTRNGALSWHSSGSTFVSSGETESGALFTCKAAWGPPGGWSLNVRTDTLDLKFSPLEKLVVSSVSGDQDTYLEESLFKDGFEAQLQDFLSPKPALLSTAKDLLRLVSFIYDIAGYE